MKNDLAGQITGPVLELGFGEPNEIRRYTPWDIDFRQIEPGPLNTRVFIRPSVSVNLLKIHMNRSVHQQGCSPEGFITLGLPNSRSLSSWNGREIDGPSLVNFGMKSEFDGVSRADFVGLTISISEHFMTGLADRIGLSLPDDFLHRARLPVRRRTSNLQWLREAGCSLLHRRGARFGRPEQESLVAGLICATADAEKFDDQSGLPARARSVRRALDYIKDRAAEGIFVSDLCAATGVSWRTLDRGFKERFGIGPKAYLNRFRLGQVRSALLNRGKVVSISDAANEWGFWHMGQLASDYRRMFGELPSVTLKQSRR